MARQEYRLKQVRLPKRELFVVKTLIGEFYDITIKTTGGATHYIIVDDVFSGNRQVYKVGSRTKAGIIAHNWFKSYNRDNCH